MGMGIRLLRRTSFISVETYPRHYGQELFLLGPRLETMTIYSVV
jgi:hypothetical protein